MVWPIIAWLALLPVALVVDFVRVAPSYEPAPVVLPVALPSPEGSAAPLSSGEEYTASDPDS